MVFLPITALWMKYWLHSFISEFSNLVLLSIRFVVCQVNYKVKNTHPAFHNITCKAFIWRSLHICITSESLIFVNSWFVLKEKPIDGVTIVLECFHSEWFSLLLCRVCVCTLGLGYSTVVKHFPKSKSLWLASAPYEMKMKIGK